jgi:hypothetical protein
MTEYETKVNSWLDTQKASKFALSSVSKPENQASFVQIVMQRNDYDFDGEFVLKTADFIDVKQVEMFFSNFEYPKNHESSFGAFRNFGLKKFVESHITCIKTTSITKTIRIEALIRLIMLKTYLSTGKASYLKAKQSVRL